MSFTPEQPDASGSGPETEPQRRSPVLVGAIVGLLIFAVVAAGFAGWRVVANNDDDDLPTTSPTADTSPTPSASAS